jgi:hypothetical protein
VVAEPGQGPSENGFEELMGHQQFMRSLSELSTRGLTREDLMHFLLMVTLVLGGGGRTATGPALPL